MDRAAVRKEVSVAPDLLERILALAGTDMVLVGGQALAFWASYYHKRAPIVAMTKDVDLLGTRSDVKRLARGLEARFEFPNSHAVTQLVGQITKDLREDEYINIDVMSGVYGDITTEALTSRAVPVEIDAGKFRVMHPLDLLQGRLENVHGLSDKRDDHGLAQLQLAIDVVQQSLQDIGLLETIKTTNPNRPIALRHIARIEIMASSDAGRKVAARYGIHVADAIDPAPVLHIKPFVSKKLPQLRKLMSAERRVQLQHL